MSGRRFRRIPFVVRSLGLHMVCCPKCCHPVLGGRVARRLDELVEQIAGKHRWQIVAKEVMPDQVHLFVRVGPIHAPPRVVSAFEVGIGRILRQEFPHLRGSATPSWSPSYFAASVGCVLESMVRRDIQRRWDAVAS